MADPSLMADPSMADQMDLAALRRVMRTRRRKLPPQTRKAAAESIARIASQRRLLRPSARVAIYLPTGGELDTSVLIGIALRNRCHLFVPRVTNHRNACMEFVAWNRDGAMRRNRFGIEQPTGGAPAPSLRTFDVIFLPLVGFSENGWRLGSGAGFYDRRLAVRHRSRWRRPRLIGLAYDLQRVAAPPLRQWDVPLDAVITESGFHLMHSTSRI
jgi:5-formyltetrahydrofolate cyclo-ligase